MTAIIYNPVSGSGKCAEMARQCAGELEKRGVSAKNYATQSVDDGAHQAELALGDGCDTIVVIGGDGTISEVVSAVAGKDVTLLFLPGGTGNDFVRMLGLPADPLEAFRAQLDGEPCRIDCMSVNGKPSINVSGSGFDVEVLRKMDEFKRIYPGGKAYRKAVFSVLSNYRPFEAELTLDGGEKQIIRATICEFANGRYFGGGMRVAPDADIADGLMDFVCVQAVPGMIIPLLLPLFILGIHVKLPIVRTAKIRRARLVSEGMAVNVDGKVVLTDEAVYEVMPGALRIRRVRHG